MLEEIRKELKDALENLNEAKAIYWLKELIVDIEDTLGEDHLYTVSFYTLLANMYASKEKYEEAYHFHQKARDIIQKEYGEESVEMVSCYNNLASALDNLGRKEEAIALIEKGITLSTRLSGENDYRTALLYDNASVLYAHIQDYDRSVSLHNQALPILIDKYGEDHINIILSYQNIAQVYIDKGEIETALRFQQKAVQLLKPNTKELKAKIDLAMNMYVITLNKYKEVIPLELFREHYKFFQEILGRNPPQETNE